MQPNYSDPDFSSMVENFLMGFPFPSPAHPVDTHSEKSVDATTNKSDSKKVYSFFAPAINDIDFVRIDKENHDSGIDFMVVSISGHYGFIMAAKSVLTKFDEVEHPPTLWYQNVNSDWGRAEVILHSGFGSEYKQPPLKNYRVMPLTLEPDNFLMVKHQVEEIRKRIENVTKKKDRLKVNVHIL
jgi:hypothetical protein